MNDQKDEEQRKATWQAPGTEPPQEKGPEPQPPSSPQPPHESQPCKEHPEVLEIQEFNELRYILHEELRRAAPDRSCPFWSRPGHLWAEAVNLTRGKKSGSKAKFVWHALLDTNLGEWGVKAGIAIGFTDGSIMGRGRGPGGWACVHPVADRISEWGGTDPDDQPTTAYRMELRAIVDLLKNAKDYQKVLIFEDNMSVVSKANRRQQEVAYTVCCQPDYCYVINHDLWNEFDRLIEARTRKWGPSTVKWMNVYAHGKQGKNWANERVQSIAGRFAKGRLSQIDFFLGAMRSYPAWQQYTHSVIAIPYEWLQHTQFRHYDFPRTIDPQSAASTAATFTSSLIAFVGRVGAELELPLQWTTGFGAFTPKPTSAGHASKDRLIHLFCPLLKAVLSIVLYKWYPEPDPDVYGYCKRKSVKKPIAVMDADSQWATKMNFPNVHSRRHTFNVV